MRKNNVRVTSDENIVRNAMVEVRVGEEWVDITRAGITGVKWVGNYGEVSRVHIDMHCADARFAGRLDAATLEVFASVLRQVGWEVSSPAAVAAA